MRCPPRRTASTCVVVSIASSRLSIVGCVKQLTHSNLSCVTQLSGLGRKMATKPWRVFGMVSIGVFASLLDLFIVNITVPDLAREFPSSSLGELSWVLNGYAIMFAALLVPAGRLADLYGRKRGFVVGLAVFTAASAACAAAPTPSVLISARV